MNRTIIDFHLDEFGDWVAALDCGHGQHVRHRPPFINRPWVTTASGREARLGSELNCVRCDRMEWPEGFAAYRRTPEFDEKTVPGGLKRNHATKRGVWARIHVLAGELRYHVGEPVGRSLRVAAGSNAVIVPEVSHRVEIPETVRFFVEFWRTEKGQRL